MATIPLSASEFQDRVGEALDRSLKQPVLITKHGRPRIAVLSYDECERLGAQDRRAFGRRTSRTRTSPRSSRARWGRDTSISTPNSGRNGPRAEGRRTELEHPAGFRFVLERWSDVFHAHRASRRYPAPRSMVADAGWRRMSVRPKSPPLKRRGARLTAATA